MSVMKNILLYILTKYTTRSQMAGIPKKAPKGA